jgi:hypothetical protein
MMELDILQRILLAAITVVSLQQVQIAQIEPQAVVKTTQTEERVREYFADLPVMIDIAKCESHFRQNDENGITLKGEIDPQDRGVMQINERYHLKEAQRLGFNIYDLEGNLGYARRLYELNGTRDWLASSQCWAIPRMDRERGLLGQG